MDGKKNAAIILTLLMCFFVAFGIICVFENDLSRKSLGNNVLKDNNEEINNQNLLNKYIKSVEYDYILEDDIEILDDDGSNKEYPFIVLNAGEKYDYFDDYITLNNGTPMIVKKNNIIKSSFSNIKKIYIMFSGEYITWYAFLTNNGDVYLGKNITTFLDNSLGLTSNIDIVYKVNSYNKYVKLNRVSSGWSTDDTEKVNILGITSEGKNDLFILNYQE